MKNKSEYLIVMGTAALWLTIGACSGEPRAGEATAEAYAQGGEHAAEPSRAEHGAPESGGEHAGAEGTGEHARLEGEPAGEEGSGEHDSGGEGEESGERIGRADTWDRTRNGARLILTFVPSSAAFEGTVENTTERTLCAVRVEVHLVGGSELGPTTPADLPAGQIVTVRLSTISSRST